MRYHSRMSKTEQIHVRVTPSDKAAIKEAADLERRSISDYLVIAALEKASARSVEKRGKKEKSR